MRIVLAVLLVGSTLGVAPAHAQHKPNCVDWDNLPQQDMNQCASEDYEAADSQLNAAWANVHNAHRQSSTWQSILDAQRLWIQFRDAHCDAEAAFYEGGSIQPLIRFSCLAAVTRQRTAQLRELAMQP